MDNAIVVSTMVTPPDLSIVPANEVSWEDLQAIFGSRGDPSRCFCQRYKLAPRESWASVGAGELAEMAWRSLESWSTIWNPHIHPSCWTRGQTVPSGSRAISSR